MVKSHAHPSLHAIHNWYIPVMDSKSLSLRRLRRPVSPAAVPRGLICRALILIRVQYAPLPTASCRYVFGNLGPSRGCPQFRSSVAELIVQS